MSLDFFPKYVGTKSILVQIIEKKNLTYTNTSNIRILKLDEFARSCVQGLKSLQKKYFKDAFCHAQSDQMAQRFIYEG